MTRSWPSTVTSAIPKYVFEHWKARKSLFRYFMELIKQNFWLSLSVSDIARFALRIVFSRWAVFTWRYRMLNYPNLFSFLKDAFVSVFTPSRYQSGQAFSQKLLHFIGSLFRVPIWKLLLALSDGLITIVQEETLDESWIPVTEKEWREQQDNENEYITKKVHFNDQIIHYVHVANKVLRIRDSTYVNSKFDFKRF